MNAYISASLARLSRLVELRGGRVLEIGGDLPPELVLNELGASAWVCVDDRSGWARSMGRHREPGIPVSEVRPEQIEAGWSCFDSSAHDIPRWVDGRFDTIVSFAALEHIPSVPKLVRRIGALLRPGGTAWLLVGPIWSGYRGHHVYPRDFSSHVEETAQFLQKVEPWQHLLMSPVEFHRWAGLWWGEQYADLLHASIFESGRINRLGFADYRLVFETSGLETANFQAWPSPEGSEPLLERVRARYPQQHGFEVDGFSILLRKPGALPCDTAQAVATTTTP